MSAFAVCALLFCGVNAWMHGVVLRAWQLSPFQNNMTRIELVVPSTVGYFIMLEGRSLKKRDYWLNSPIHFDGGAQSQAARWIEVSSEIRPVIDERRRQLALESFTKYPDAFSEEAKTEILAQRIVSGMTPYQAQLAGGSFTFKVKPDARWPKDADPLLVIETQSVDPDDSEINLIFKNRTQFLDKGLTEFRVDFSRGRVINIMALN